MARLIPSFIDEAAPPGERDVYNMLAGGPQDWVVLHSLDLAPWNSSRRTEVDFVVFIPDAGILCIEVKSHHELGFNGETWYPATIKRSPFKQAMDARYALRRRLCDLSTYARCIPVVHCCVFPNARFEVLKNLSIRPWEVMDVDAFRSFSTPAQFCADLRQRLLDGAGDEGLPALDAPMPPQRVENLVGLCVPIQRRRPSAAEEIRKRRDDMEKLLREQQRPVLRLAEWNDRLLVTGGAGTGKTLIAMELARRAAERGDRVALVCHNRLVGGWIAAELSQGSPLPNLIAGSARSLLMRMAGITAPVDADAVYWDETLPALLEERFTDPDFASTAEVDYLIVDEAQDILGRPELWECLTSLLTGGLDHGRFALFGDLEHQVLGGKGSLLASMAGVEERARPVTWHLSENCRNFRIVGDSALRLSGFPTDIYSGYLRTGDSVDDIAYVRYADPDEQLAKLKEILQHAQARGFRRNDITILSFTAPEKGVAPRLKTQGYKITPAEQEGDEIRYASVQAFKGMESPVVIVTDINLGMGDLSRSLFYTALTRSTAIVRVLCSAEDGRQLLTWSGGVGA
jgi:hypothetical protein